MSFRDARAANFRNVFLNQGHFAETITYLPADGGDAIEIVADVVQRVDETEDRTETGRLDVLVVTFSNDPAATNAAGDALGGVDEPQRGDAIYRSGNCDPEDKLYAFRGRVLASDDHSWTLEFEREELQQIGMMGK